MTELEVAWRKCCRAVLNVNQRTRSILIPQLMGTRGIKEIIQERVLNLYRQGINHQNELISNIFRNSLLTNLPPLTININQILKEFKIKYSQLFQVRKIKLKHETQNLWRINMLKELIHIRDFKLFNFLTCEETAFLLDYLRVL